MRRLLGHDKGAGALGIICKQPALQFGLSQALEGLQIPICGPGQIDVRGGNAIGDA